MSYLLWFDDNKHRSVEEKIAAACDAYQTRFRVRPNVVLVNNAERVRMPGIMVCSEEYVQPHHFWVGREE